MRYCGLCHLSVTCLVIAEKSKISARDNGDGDIELGAREAIELLAHDGEGASRSCETCLLVMSKGLVLNVARRKAARFACSRPRRTLPTYIGSTKHETSN